jgi:hypothetical protein
MQTCDAQTRRATNKARETVAPTLFARRIVALVLSKTVAFVFLLTAAATSEGFQTTGDWVRLNSDAGGFSVLMPGTEAPKENVETKRDARVGTYTTHRFMKASGGGAFVVRWLEYDPNVKLDAQGELAADRDNFVKGVNARVVSESQITLDGNPGIEFTAENTDATFKSRVYVVGQRAYILVAFAPKGTDDAGAVNKFLSSFEMKKPDK